MVDMPAPPTQSVFAPRAEVCTALNVDSQTFAQAHARFPVLWPQAYLDAALGSSAIAAMGKPDMRETLVNPADLADPVSDLALRPVPFLVRKHIDRVILLTTKSCHFYCRFCFRRAESHRQAGNPSRSDWALIFDYLRANPEIREAILSGGDPLTLSNQNLAWILEQLDQIPSIQKVRIHSRAPVHFPQRVDAELVSVCAQGKPLRLVCHFNHLDECQNENLRVIQMFQTAGISVGNQAVLLAGVNDSPADQVALWSRLWDWQIWPHYLHHPDRAPGNAHFRVSIQKGLDIYGQMQKSAQVPLPSYVLDLPDGSGKIPVAEMDQLSNGAYQYRHPDGRISTYQDGGV